MDDDKLPRFSYDLIELLDQTVQRPSFPATAHGVRLLGDEAMRLQAAFTAGARAVVDQLVDMRDAELSDAERETEDSESGGVSDGPRLRFPRLFGSDGNVREISPPVRVAGMDIERLLADGDNEG